MTGLKWMKARLNAAFLMCKSEFPFTAVLHLRKRRVKTYHRLYFFLLPLGEGIQELLPLGEGIQKLLLGEGFLNKKNL